MEQVAPLVRQILIVGGGTAGWMAALYLRRRTRCQVTLIESPDIPTIGVGEATIPALIDFLQQMKLDEDEFMRRCHATYKLAIRFVGWTRPQHEYWHPFGLCGGNIDNLDLFHFWLKRERLNFMGRPYSGYSLQALLCEMGRAHRPIGGESVVQNYAFHLDAGAFANYMRDIAVKLGVVHRLENVERVECDSKGMIERVVTAGGEPLAADMYIDCTGFGARLIEKGLGDPYIDWSKWLLCDRAVALPLPVDPEPAPYTRATAGSSGWFWQIPLSTRTGSGYVYSSNHISPDHAAAELLRQMGQPESRLADARPLKMRVGRRTNFWKGNCISVGLAAGFIEPLESTGIFLIQRALEVLVDWFPDTAYQESLVAAYNRRLAAVYEEVRDFVLLHYLVSGRDEPFWRDSQQVEIPDSLQTRLELYRQTGIIMEAPLDPVFRATNYYHILTGGERLPKCPRARADFSDFPAVCQLMDKIRSQNDALANQLPTHGQLIQWLHHGS